MAIVLPKLSGRNLSARRSVAERAEPALGVRLRTLQAALEPGEMLDFDVIIQRVSVEQIDHLEISVAWYVEGKGSDDFGLLHFESVPQVELVKQPMDQGRGVSVRLPRCPLSYEGKLFSLRWCIRLRLFLADGRSVSAEQPFYLGPVTNEV